MSGRNCCMEDSLLLAHVHEPHVSIPPSEFGQNVLDVGTGAGLWAMLAGEARRGTPSAILAFSISHDHRTVRIYGHYPVVDGKNTTFYRHPIREFSFTELDGKEKWTAYRFTKNLYEMWVPTYLERICSVFEELPSELDFEVSQQSEPEESGFVSHYLSDQSNHYTASMLEADS
ncbi:uncharacterized protein RAG0_12575 [Rhynchosporium agropyri]|uniref:DUF7924 domain-containing protein n=1 Tax=Rhynchosporium agropyri TaxID=914238 RepID=A0A1E1L904_9HELO|nr:uncharacterized protein RAG0_12575 [Rhynchosporium agropyri]